jgi:hypothetical protein
MSGTAAPHTYSCMTTTSNDQPRGHNGHPGKYTNKTQTPGVLNITPNTPQLGSFPVHLEDLPNIGNYRFTAAALGWSSASTLVPYFTQSEFEGLRDVINRAEEESDQPLIIQKDRDGLYFTSDHNDGDYAVLPHIDTVHGTLWALDTHGGDPRFEITEGRWFSDGGTEHNFTEVISDKAVGDTFDRSWAIRRDDGEFVTRTVTWFVEECDDSDMVDINVDGDRTVSYSVWCRTQDAVAEELHGADSEPLTDTIADDHLETDQSFDTLEDAQDYARSRANGADAYFHVADWDGHVA